MPKKAVLSLVLSLFILLQLFLCGGCGGKEGGGPAASKEAPGSQHIQLTQEHKELYATYLRPLGYSGELFGVAEPLPPSDDYGFMQDLEVVDALLDEEALTLTAEVYGTVLLNLETGEEIIDNYSYIENAVAVRPPADDPHYPYLLLGTATVKLRETAAGTEVLSCHWEPLENPGHRVLEETGKAAAEAIAASERPDLSQYDRRIVDYLYRVIRSQRQIAGIDEITRWDLENLCTDLTFDYMAMGEDYMEDPPPLDAEALRLIPTLRSLSTKYPLTDYSVFEGMDLEQLMLHSESEAASPAPINLRAKHIYSLSIDGFRQDIAVDLSGTQVDYLYISSWVAAVTDLRGCEGVKHLNFNHTRSDTRIINAETFPHAETLLLSFMSDYARFRDLSRLATFGEDVRIDLTLTYQAANNRTVASLEGVRLDSLTLDPKNGQWPLDEPDPALVERIKAQQVEWAN